MRKIQNILSALKKQNDTAVQCADVVITEQDIITALRDDNKDTDEPLLHAFRKLTAFFEENKDLLPDAVHALLDHLEFITPERNCVCHMGCPPCADCVEYSQYRELIRAINEILPQAAPDKKQNNISIDDDSGII